MCKTPLIFGLWKVSLYGIFDACKAVSADDKNVFDTSVLEFIEYEQPVLSTLVLAYVDARTSLCPPADMSRTIFAAFLRTPTLSLTA